jgi:hypothetical protein
MSLGGWDTVLSAVGEARRGSGTGSRLRRIAGALW